MNEPVSIVIYTPRITNRLRYVCNHIFKRSLELDYWITDHLEEAHSNSFIIEYADQPGSKYFSIPASGLIWEDGIIKEYFLPVVSGEQSNKRLFPQTAGATNVMDFDLFSAVFYCLSLYQAYTPMAKDQHGRIDFSEWWLRKLGLDNQPYVDVWIMELKHRLSKHGVHSNLEIQQSLKISFDIDHCWAFKNRTLLRSLKGIGGDILKGRIVNLKERLSVLAGRATDPYQEFFYWLENHVKKEITLFFLMIEGKKDSLNVWNKEKSVLISKLSKYFKVGLHPSYFTKDQPDSILQEMNLLKSCSGKPVTLSRQHFLRWGIPDTFMELHAAGIQQEHSIGYYDQPGFLAATSRPFRFYNLREEREISMDFHPFCWMDSMNKYYRVINEETEWQEIQELHRKAIEAGGTASLVFHNDSFIIYRYRKILDALSDC
jgi:hypothetical protein